MNARTPLDLDALDAISRRIVAGDADALGDVFDALAGALHGVALRRCGDAAAAERVVEALFRELWLGRATLVDGSRVWVPRLFARCHVLAAPDPAARGRS